MSACELPARVWTVIALRSAAMLGGWEALEGAPMTPAEAVSADERGEVWAMHRRADDGEVELVVRPRPGNATSTRSK